MAKPSICWASVSGKLNEFFQGIFAAVLRAGGGDDDLERARLAGEDFYDRVAEAVMACNGRRENWIEAQIPVSRMTGDLDLALAFSSYDSWPSDLVDSRVAWEHEVPLEYEPCACTVDVLKLPEHMSSEEVSAWMRERGYRPANVFHLLHAGSMRPKLQIEFPIVAIGSVATIYGVELFVRLDSEGRDTTAPVRVVGVSKVKDATWSQTVRFAAVRTIGYAGEPQMLAVDRTKQFDPSAFQGSAGWQVHSCDSNSLMVARVNLSMIRLFSMRERHEANVTMAETINRLAETHSTPLDAALLLELWQNRELIPARWKRMVGNERTRTHFVGTVLTDESGQRFTLCLFWNGDDWRLGRHWLKDDMHPHDLCAVLVN